jgi:hypothetical protein
MSPRIVSGTKTRGREPDGGALEARRGDADDRHRLAVDDDRLVEHGGVGAEVRGPVGVAQHRDEVRAHGLVVGGGEEPPSAGRSPSTGKYDPETSMPLRVHRLAAEGEVGAERPVRGEPGEHPLAALEVAEHGVRDTRSHSPAWLHDCEPRLGSGAPDVDEPRRLLHGQRAQQHLVEEREGRRVGADPERQRDHRHRGDEGRLEEPSERELEVGHVVPTGSCGPGAAPGGGVGGCVRARRRSCVGPARHAIGNGRCAGARTRERGRSDGSSDRPPLARRG